MYGLIMGLLTVALMTWVDDDDGVIDVVVAVAAAVVDVVERNGFFCFVVVGGC